MDSNDLDLLLMLLDDDLFWQEEDDICLQNSIQIQPADE